MYLSDYMRAYGFLSVNVMIFCYVLMPDARRSAVYSLQYVEFSR